MKCYRIEMMTPYSFNTWMSGNYNYSCDYAKIVAQDKEQALDKAQYFYPNMVINQDFVDECEMDNPHYDQLTIADFGITV